MPSFNFTNHSSNGHLPVFGHATVFANAQVFIPIEIRTPRGSSVQLRVMPQTTLLGVKRHVCGYTGLAESTMVLQVQNSVDLLTEDGLSLEALGLATDGHTLVLDIVNPIFVELGEGSEDEVVVYVNLGFDNEASLKAKLEKITGVPADEQRLSFESVPLIDLPLRNQGVGETGTVVMERYTAAELDGNTEDGKGSDDGFSTYGSSDYGSDQGQNDYENSSDENTYVQINDSDME